MTVSGYHHLVLFCRDTERSRRFYEALGFRYLRGYDGMHWLAVGEAELMLHEGGSAGRGHGPSIHFATPDVVALFEQAVAAGLEPFDHDRPGERLTGPVRRPWGAREFELRDPDGHALAFTESR